MQLRVLWRDPFIEEYRYGWRKGLRLTDSRNHGSARKSPVWRMAPFGPSIRYLEWNQTGLSITHMSYLHNSTGAMICIESSDDHLLVFGELNNGRYMEVYRFLIRWHYMTEGECIWISYQKIARTLVARRGVVYSVNLEMGIGFDKLGT